MYSIEIEFGENTIEAVAGRLREIAKLVEENSLEEGDGWVMSEDAEAARPAPRSYDVEIKVEQLVSDDQLDSDDREDGPGSEYCYTVEAYSEEGAQEAALDKFHSEVAIHTLEHFEIIPAVRESVPAAS